MFYSSDNEIYNIIKNNKILFDNIFNNDFSIKNLKNIINNIDNNIINKFDNILYNMCDEYLAYITHYYNVKISRYYSNGLYFMEDYNWTREELIKEYIILLLCAYYEYANDNNKQN